MNKYKVLITALYNEYGIVFEMHPEYLELKKYNARPKLVFSRKITKTELMHIDLKIIIETFLDDYNTELLKLVDK